MKLPFSRTFNEKPILFNTEMVKAILEGRKTQTRRVVKPQPDFETAKAALGGDTSTAIPAIDFEVAVDMCGAPLLGLKRGAGFGYTQPNIKCPYGKPGDRLWVRETWALAQYDFDHIPDERIYRADFGNEPVDWNWKPSIFMPREVSRILLEITDIRVERVQEISKKDAIAEGIEFRDGITTSGKKYSFPRYYTEEEDYKNIAVCTNPIDSYRTLWDSINDKRGFGWGVNPWVWVVEFKRIEMPLSEQQTLSEMQQDCYDNCEI